MSDKKPLDPNQPVLYIDHCRHRKNFRRDALKLHGSLAEALRALNPRVNLQLRINENGPPEEGAFEVAIAPAPTESAAHRQQVWTGLRRVPVSSKVPHVDDILSPVCKALKLQWMDEGESEAHRRKMSNLRRSRSEPDE